jgi:fimbrial chaperone protein
MTILKPLRFVLLAGFALAGAPFLFASTFHVSPMRILLTDRKPNTVLEIGNEGDEPVTVQVRVVAWQPHGVGDQYPQTDDIFLSPPIAKIAPHGNQIIRIALRHKEALTAERAYQVSIEEVPGPEKPGFKGIRTLLRINIPIYRKPANPAAAAKPAWTADYTEDGSLRITASNTGDIHFVVKELSVAAAGMKPISQESPQCVLAGGKREWIFRDERLKNATPLTLEVDTDSEKVHEEIIPKGK